MISSIIFGWTQIAILILFLLMSVISPSSQASIGKKSNYTFQINWDSVFVVSYTVVWYICTYCLCYAFKQILDDRLCSGHPNSVSGHYCYHLFYLLSISYLTVRMERNPQVTYTHVQNHRRIFDFFSKTVRPSTKVISVFVFMIFACSFFTLSQTYLFGYHTLRQIFYGCILAIASHTLLIYLFERGCKGHVHVLLLTLGAKILTCFTFVWVITHEIPFKNRELILCAVMTAAAVYSYYFKLNGNLKDSSAATELQLNEDQRLPKNADD